MTAAERSQPESSIDVALIYPPTCDPTAPYLAVPTLTAWLRRDGLRVLPIDANVEAWTALLTRDRLAPLADRMTSRRERLERKGRLPHVEQLLYGTLWDARGDAETAPAAIDAAIATLRDPVAFHDPARYDAAVATVESALRVVSAAHAPLDISFTGYRTPFSFLTPATIADDARDDRDPFHAEFVAIAARLRAASPAVVGISVAFPGQLQPAYSLAHVLARELPGVHLTVGGPAITQLLTRLAGDRLARAIAPFHSAVLFEGELALTSLVRAVLRGEPPPLHSAIRGEQIEDLGRLPAPDFDGLPLDRYLSPHLVLPYDPTRGCYWGKCTFCHYGLAEVGTAAYRERPVDTMMSHLRELATRHGVTRFYLSQDSVSPKTALKLARAIRDAGEPWKWATDMRPEKSLTPERCQELADGGAVAMAYGVESAAPRVLKMIDKGVPVETVERAIENLASAGVAVEAMCFTDFPTETYREAIATIELLHRQHGAIALFICGEFDLTHGSLVAQTPAKFGVAETWALDGDELGCGLFWNEAREPKSPRDQERIDRALGELSARWRLARYPWAGALSTAHTLLYYERGGPSVFKDLAVAAAPDAPVARMAAAKFDVVAVADAAREVEAAIWRELVHERRAVSPALYRELAAKAPHALPRITRVRYQAGAGVERTGRRPSNAVNAAKIW
jgi:hypothetical protein|nr:radical SAM protein [Kofleriaceae bacterium]